jgi:D-arabinose 1-dehydrogenase-like Zn-dependent alcohol dehydrogenase
MQAAVVPAANSAWQVKEVPQPKPGTNQVLVKMHASGICYTDVHLTLGHFPGTFPRILGHEPVGESSATAWVPLGFNPLADAANGASAGGECFVLT